MFTPTGEQEDALGLFASGVDMVIQAGAGCLSGSTVLHVNRGGKGSRMTLAHVAAQFNGQATMRRTLHGREVEQRAKPWDPSIPTRVALADDGVVRLGNVEDVWCSGEREVFELATVGGRRIRATDEHPFLTKHGWRRLGEIEPGDVLAVNTGRSPGVRAAKAQYRMTDTRCHPHQVRRSRERDRWGVPTHRLVIEAAMNGMAFEAYVRLLRLPELRPGIAVLPRDEHVHHMDGDTFNNTPGNLERLTASDHARHHAAEGGAEHVLWQVGSDTVESITPRGVEVTYDLAMVEAPHNYIANGFVVHNTGKTSTLVLLAEDSTGRGQYVVFNKAAALDAMKRFPVGVGCSTMHSIAARATEPELRARLGKRREPSWVTADHLGIKKAIYFSLRGRPRALQPSWLSSHVMRALKLFCRSADAEPGPHHFPIVDNLDVEDDHPNNRALADMLMPYLDRAWADVQRPDGKLRFEHDHYMKAWALTGPQLPVDFLLVDEAQDLAPVEVDVFSAQECQTVWVGDSCQQIYQWRGAVDALSSVDADVETFLTRSFRFGNAIAAMANDVLGLLPTKLRLEGNPQLDSTVTRLSDPKAILCRTNAVSVEHVMRYRQDARRVHLVGGGAEVIDFARAAIKLREGRQCDHIELGCFASWEAVQQYVMEDPLGGELKLLVNLVDQFGPDAIIEALEDEFAEDQADIVVSTAHKAKGREWDTVQLAGDFPDFAVATPEEFRLYYVAVTRARHVIDPFNTEMFRALSNRRSVA